MDGGAMSEERPKQRRGFALMTPERLKEISRAGGRRAHALGNAHEFDAKEAQAAGRKGGLAAAETRRRSRRERP